MCSLFKALAEDDFLKALGSMFDFILKAINLYVVYWIFKQNFSERRNERLRDANRDSRKFVIQEVILKPNIDLIKGFFESNRWGLLLLREAKQKPNVSHEEILAAGEKELAKFKEEMDKIKERIVFPLSSLSPSFSNLQTIINDTEDRFTDYVQSFLVSSGNPTPESEPKQAAELLRGKFVEGLIEGQLNCLSCIEPEGEHPSLFQKIFG